jgi:hypothetical protein
MQSCKVALKLDSLLEMRKKDKTWNRSDGLFVPFRNENRVVVRVARWHIFKQKIPVWVMLV